MKDLLAWMRARLLFDGEGGDAGGDLGGGGGGPAGGDGGPMGDLSGAGGDSGQNDATWRDRILKGTEYYGDPNLATIPDELTLVKNYLFTKKKVGEKGIIPPKPEASAEEWGEFFAAVPRPADDASPEVKAAYQRFMGSPEAATAYDESIVAPEDFPKEFLREDLIAEYKQAAFEAGVPPAYAKAMFDWYMGRSKADLGTLPPIKEIAPGVFRNETVFKDNTAKVTAEFKAELGDAFDSEIARADAEIWAAGGEQLSNFLKETGLSEHPVIVRAFMNVAKRTREDGSLDHGRGGKSTDLQAQLDLISTNPALLDRNHADHTKVVVERDRLMNLLHPDTEEEV